MTLNLMCIKISATSQLYIYIYIYLPTLLSFWFSDYLCYLKDCIKEKCKVSFKAIK